jgi:chromodomain-helicase-DNA-binding protein 4
LQGDPKAGEVTNEELKSEPKPTTIPSYKSVDTDTQMIDQLPQVGPIGMILLFAHQILFS